MKTKPGRPPLGEQESKTIHLVLSGETYEQISKLAAKDQRSVMSMTRVLVSRGLGVSK